MITSGMSTKNGGISPAPYCMNTSYSVGDKDENVSENRRIFFHALGVAPDRLAIPQQHHTPLIRRIEKPGTYPECDALMTDVPEVLLSVTVADCAPILLYDRKNQVIAGVHAGWRGTEQRILLKTLLAMHKEFHSEPKDIYGFIGPSARVCCYEVGREVAEQFDSECVFHRGGKLYLDIEKANNTQFRNAGVPVSNIETHEDCTICTNELYHSYRRDREQSGRMLAVIALTR
jgi:polyphenol oxidase